MTPPPPSQRAHLIHGKMLLSEISQRDAAQRSARGSAA